MFQKICVSKQKNLDPWGETNGAPLDPPMILFYMNDIQVSDCYIVITEILAIMTPYSQLLSVNEILHMEGICGICFASPFRPNRRKRELKQGFLIDHVYLNIGRSRGHRQRMPPKGPDSFVLTYKFFET